MLRQVAPNGKPVDSGYQAGIENHLELTCKLLYVTWHGNPVYELVNHSDEALAHISVLSFSEQYLPILWLGPQSQPNSIERISPVPPPATLPAHQALWFAGPQTNNHISLRNFKIEWLKDGNEQSESVQPTH